MITENLFLEFQDFYLVALSLMALFTYFDCFFHAIPVFRIKSIFMLYIWKSLIKQILKYILYKIWIIDRGVGMENTMQIFNMYLLNVRQFQRIKICNFFTRYITTSTCIGSSQFFQQSMSILWYKIWKVVS